MWTGEFEIVNPNEVEPIGTGSTKNFKEHYFMVDEEWMLRHQNFVLEEIGDESVAFFGGKLDSKKNIT